MKRICIIILLFLSACTQSLDETTLNSLSTMINLDLTDADGDGIPNETDKCANTFVDEIANEQGCTARQLRLYASNVLPYQFEKIVRYVDRIPLRQSKKFEHVA